MNKVIFMGRLTKDPQVGTTAAGKKYAHYSIAVDRTYKKEGQPEADFFNVSVLNEKGAEFVEKYLHKGTKVVLEGSLQNNNYTDKNGVQHYDVQVIQNSVEFAESKKTAEANAQTAGAQPAPQTAAQPVPQPAPAQSGFAPVLDENLPFN